MYFINTLKRPDIIFLSIMTNCQFDSIIQNLATLWIIVMVSVAMICFLVSEITRNYSQVDKLWSLMPIAYSWITAVFSPSPRLFVMAILVTIWGLRLSYNFYRKGGYSIIPWKGAEDYRWQVIREHPMLKGRLKFGLFNLVFISLYQNILILLFSSPLLLASLYPDKSLTILDLVASVLMLTFITAESIADKQQFIFHQEKHDGKKEGARYEGSLKKGFLTEGLWRYSRHPNFASEQATWISFYFFGVAASGKWINFTLSGSLLLVLLFMASTQLTERISSRKYPDYAGYRKEVPKFLPDLLGVVKKKH
jgi:steroid 5-alpha reductase family enzyme